MISQKDVGDRTERVENSRLTMYPSITINTTLKGLDESDDDMIVVSQAVGTLLDGVPVLMKALDEVAKIHPFVAGKLYDGSFQI